MKNMDAVSDSDLSAMSPNIWSNLHKLDLRGCKRINGSSIIGIIRTAPLLQTISLKGLQSTTPAVLTAISQFSKRMIELDVSRCWRLSLGDIQTFVQSLSDIQGQNIRTLKISGLGFRSTDEDQCNVLGWIVIRLSNLRNLDLNGCRSLVDRHFRIMAEFLEDHSHDKVTSLRHLVITDCSSLGLSTIGHLTDRLPRMAYLEMANIPNILEGADVRSTGQVLVRFLTSMPSLKKLDLDETGRWGGGMGDGFLSHFGSRQGTSLGEKRLNELHLGYAYAASYNGIYWMIRRIQRGRSMILNLNVSRFSFQWPCALEILASVLGSFSSIVGVGGR